MSVEHEQSWACPCTPAEAIVVGQPCPHCGMDFQAFVQNWPKVCPTQTVHGEHHDSDPTWARIMGSCAQRPCVCAHALVSGCTCGLYLCPITRRAGHHSSECGIFLKETER